MLKVENVNLFYGAAQALRGVSLTAEIGKVTCVLGRNGVGKTSLMRAIVGHHPIRSGRIEWQGEDLKPLPSPSPSPLRVAVPSPGQARGSCPRPPRRSARDRWGSRRCSA